jgi:hypothetical protein
MEKSNRSTEEQLDGVNVAEGAQKLRDTSGVNFLRGQALEPTAIPRTEYP